MLSIALSVTGQASVSPMASTCGGVRDLFRANTCCGQTTEKVISSLDICPALDVQITYPATKGTWTPCPIEEMHMTYSADNSMAPGYSGCVSEAGSDPCGWYDYYSYSPTTGCSQTATMQTAIQTVRGGSPTMTADMLRLTGKMLNPTISFPALPMSYPPGRDNSNPDGMELEVTWKKFMNYFGSQLDLTSFKGYPSYGAEMGMDGMVAIKILELLQTTCTRNFYVLLEAPAYGYDWTHAKQLAERSASSWYNAPECSCYNASTCTTLNTITISQRGWAPARLPALPSEAGDDGVMYTPDSTAANSPWIQTNVLPGNPIGRFRACRTPADRCLCDGVYWYPAFLPPGTVMPNFQCYAWAFATTKIYSAQLRAGIMFVQDTPTANTAASNVWRRMLSIGNGLMSHMQVYSQIQLMNKIMETPYSVPTSWVNALGVAQREKWDVMYDAFAVCKAAGITQITDEQPKYSGAYIFSHMMVEFHGLSANIGASSSDFFKSVVGYDHFNYNWGWRGEGPEEYGIGAGITSLDFHRTHTFRARDVYVEEARRMRLVCGDRNAKVTSSLLSVNEWKALRLQDQASGRRRRLDAGEKISHHERATEVQQAVPRMELLDAIKYVMMTDPHQKQNQEYGIPDELVTE